MNTVDLIKKVSASQNLSSGRVEMIVSIIFEKISDRLARENSVKIENFGEFSITDKSASLSDENTDTGISKFRKIISFTPDNYFLDNINPL